MAVYHVHASFIKQGHGRAADIGRYLARERQDQAGQLHRYVDREQGIKDDLVASVVLGLFLLAIGGLVGYQLWHPPEMSYARALGSIDATLMQQWGSLPKGTQEAFTSAYQRLGLQAPPQRSK